MLELPDDSRSNTGELGKSALRESFCLPALAYEGSELRIPIGIFPAMSLAIGPALAGHSVIFIPIGINIKMSACAVVPGGVHSVFYPDRDIATSAAPRADLGEHAAGSQAGRRRRRRTSWPAGGVLRPSPSTPRRPGRRRRARSPCLEEAERRYAAAAVASRRQPVCRRPRPRHQPHQAGAPAPIGDGVIAEIDQSALVGERSSHAGTPLLEVQRRLYVIVVASQSRSPIAAMLRTWPPVTPV